MISHSKAKPFFKWAGGKKLIVKELVKRLPPTMNNYYEPFLGSGALFFEIQHLAKTCFLSDVNEELISAYLAMKDDFPTLVTGLELAEYNHYAFEKIYYNYIRNRVKIGDGIYRASRFIYLMNTCFNGLYRVNKENKFNTPIGARLNKTLFDWQNLKIAHQVLQNTVIKHQDFSSIKPQEGDFVYFDPPYIPLNGKNPAQYTANRFTIDDHIRLRDLALELSKQGVNVMISQADSDIVRELYIDFKMEQIPVRRRISCQADNRKVVEELIITSYE